MSRAERTTLYLFLAPALLMLLVFTIWPALWATYVSTTNMALVGADALNYRFTGFKNYLRLFRDPSFRHSLLITLEYTALTNVGQFIIGLIAALLLSRRKLRGAGFLLAIIILPMVIPSVIQALTWASMLTSGELGTLNRLIGIFGGQPIAWLQKLPMLSIVLVNFWNNSGFAMLLFLAGLESISQEILEAAVMDGANSWQMLTYVKLPLIRQVILLWLLLNTLGCFNVFALVFTLTRGGPGEATELMGLYIYHRGFKYFELGYGSAAALIMMAVSLIVALLYVRMLRARV